tara:strand:- start:155 stop:631 length:477 start_codon:yes stop_codon:yes gene_type:complete
MGELEIVQDHIRREGPVDMQLLIEDLGIEYGEDDFRNDLTTECRRDGYRIKVNRHLSDQRKRFAAAHGLAHYLLHRDIIAKNGGIHRDTLFDDKRMSGGGITEAYQAQANKLAVQMLMPLQRIRNLLKAGQNDVVLLSDEFGVSVKAMEIRLGTIPNG